MISKVSKINQSQSKALALPSPQPPTTVVPSLISADIVVNGDITAIGEIQIDGTIIGNLRAAQITVGQKATVRGDIVAEEIIVRGHVAGTITGRRVHLSGTSYVQGDIRHESMAMEMGARLDGSCRHTAADPLALAAPAPALPQPKPLSLARAAKVEEPTVAPSAAPEASIASVDPVAAPVSNLEALKSTGSEMRARTSKSLSGASGGRPSSKAVKKPDIAAAIAEPVESAVPETQEADRLAG